jgi:hypothetical protein
MNESFLVGIKKFYKSKPEGKEQVIALFDFLLGFFQEKDFNGCWCIKTVSEISKDNQLIRSEIQLQKMNFLALINGLVQNCFDSKTAQEIDLLTKQIYLLYESAVAESHLHQANWPILSAKKLCLHVLDFDPTPV